MLQDTGLVHLLILPHLITMVQGLAKGRGGKTREDKSTQVYKIRNEEASHKSHNTTGAHLFTECKTKPPKVLRLL